MATASIEGLDAGREVIRHCQVLSRFSEEPGYTTRTFLSAPTRDVHNYLAAWMTDLGMAVHVDPAGNLRGLYPGSSPGAPRMVIGSHLDTVPRAGAYDGVLGVVLGVALVESLKGSRLPFAIEVIGFSEEEGIRFGVPFIGSRALAGMVDHALLARRDANGRSVADVIRDFGLDPCRLGEAEASTDAIGYLEFHIEQGPVLESLGVPLGIVTAIVGQTRVDGVFTGMAGHAGTTPMPARHDALAGAVEWIAAVEREARDTPGLVATVGRIEVQPGAANVIPGRCAVTLDVRHLDDGQRAASCSSLAARARAIASRRGLVLEWMPRLDQPAVAMDHALVAALERAVRRVGVPVHYLTSGAGHDAMIVAARLPAAMLFLRSPGGLSHHPEESVVADDVALALAAGGRFLEAIVAGETSSFAAARW